MQSKNKKTNSHIKKEIIHNLISLTFFFIISLLSLWVLIFSIKNNWIFLIVINSIMIFFSLLKIILQFRVSISFINLKSKIDQKNIIFYILKSWTRKYYSSFWLGFLVIFYLIYLVFLNLIIKMILNTYDQQIFLINIYYLLITLLVFTFSMIFNIMILKKNIRFIELKINVKTIEWGQIKLAQNIIYKNIFLYLSHISLVFTLILMFIPWYKKLWFKKN